ncbi:hypothetical protein GE09DRAFT_1229330 [Coniochaeta sp. 2T2.1]|nr:hypothetical protein GE09DRAFT_1229330 [Coniochaeta sp. 2T2.1]
MHGKLYISSLLVALLPQAVLGLPAACSAVGKAVYLISNGPENNVIALPIGADGTLSKGSSIATGGAGSNSVDSATNQPAAPDALVSQGSLTLAGENLFAVNAGSNTVTMFAIDSKDPTKLTMVGKPVSVPGEFPNTVAASAKNKLVCVGSSGVVAGISCSRFSAQGIESMDQLRPFDLKQTTPPVGPLNTVSHAFFSRDEGTLFTTVKGDPTVNNTGFLAAFPVSASCSGSSVSQEAANSSPDGTAVLFGSSPIPGSNNLFVTDASFGGAVLDIKGNVATVKGKGVIDGQKATCWVAISAATKTAFVTDVASNRLVEMSITDATILGQIDLSANGDPGLVDLAAAGMFVYALSPGNGTTQATVTVVDAVKKQQVQHFSLESLGAGKNAQGMVALL